LDLGNLLYEKFDYPHASGQATEFSPTRAAAVVLENKLMPDLSNSFLVVAGSGDLPSDDVLVYTYNSVRQKPYCKSNLFVRGGDLRVIRQRLYPEAPLPANQPLTHHIVDEDYIPGRLLSTYALDIVMHEGWTLADLSDWAGKYYRVLADHSPKPKKSGASATPSGSPSGTTTPPASSPASAADSGLITDPLWDHNAKTWLKDMAAMVVLSLLFTALAWWRLLKLSPGRRK